MVVVGLIDLAVFDLVPSKHCLLFGIIRIVRFVTAKVTMDIPSLVGRLGIVVTCFQVVALAFIAWI
jgi:hypothetical protein